MAALRNLVITILRLADNVSIAAALPSRAIAVKPGYGQAQPQQTLTPSGRLASAACRHV
jgi:hypothetical protein